MDVINSYDWKLRFLTFFDISTAGGS